MGLGWERKPRKRTACRAEAPHPHPIDAITHHFVLDVAGAVGVVEGRDCLVDRVSGWAYTRDEQGLAVAPERILKSQQEQQEQQQNTLVGGRKENMKTTARPWRHTLLPPGGRERRQSDARGPAGGTS